MTNPLQMLVLVLEAAKQRLVALQERLEARFHSALCALECETNARAYARIADADLGHATTHLLVARDFVDEAWGRLTPTTGPAEVEDSLARARGNAERALAHLHLFTAAHADGIAARWGQADHEAWSARLSTRLFGAAPPLGWAVADTTTVCRRCGAYRFAGDAVYDARGQRYCAELCFRSEQQDEGAAWYADHRDAETEREMAIYRRHAEAPLCPVCRCLVFDDRFARTLPTGERVAFCSTECAAEAAQAEIDQTEHDERHELDADELEAMYLAEEYGEPGVDLDECPF